MAEVEGMVITTPQGATVLLIPLVDLGRLLQEAAEQARTLGYQEGLADATRIREVIRA